MEDGDEASIGPYMLRIGMAEKDTLPQEEAAPGEYALRTTLEQPQLAQVS